MQPRGDILVNKIDRSNADRNLLASANIGRLFGNIHKEKSPLVSTLVNVRSILNFSIQKARLNKLFLRLTFIFLFNCIILFNYWCSARSINAQLILIVLKLMNMCILTFI